MYYYIFTHTFEMSNTYLKSQNKQKIKLTNIMILFIALQQMLNKELEEYTEKI